MKIPPTIEKKVKIIVKQLGIILFYRKFYKGNTSLITSKCFTNKKCLLCYNVLYTIYNKENVEDILFTSFCLWKNGIQPIFDGIKDYIHLHKMKPIYTNNLNSIKILIFFPSQKTL